jgi:hypothetical protein
MDHDKQFAVCAAIAVVLLCALSTEAQATPPQGSEKQSAQENAGVTAGNYRIKQSVEAGWRAADIGGSLPVFDTFVNQHTGPRLLESSFEMQSLNHAGLPFDTLSFTGSGFGGDPNTLSRLRMDKNRWYNLKGTFRRDLDVWDYNLLANPLNPPTASPSLPIAFSPHTFDVSRHMTDLDLTLLPQSSVRVRLGYSRNSSSGSNTTTVYEGGRLGAETLLAQPWRMVDDTYHLGVDLRMLPRTNVSYDQSFQASKDDTAAADHTFPFQLTNGTPADLGLVFDTNSFDPCAKPIANPTTNPPTANPICNLFTTYSRGNRSRIFFPTEQFSFQTSYFRNFDVSGRVSYSAAELSLPSVTDVFAGLLSATAVRQSSGTVTASGKRITVGADLGATWDVTERLRILDTLHVANFRSPGATFEDLALLFGGSALSTINVFSSATCPPPFNSNKCPLHSNQSPADGASNIFGRFLGQDSTSNQIEVQYDFAKVAGARLGYRFHDRSVNRRALTVANEMFFPTLPFRGDCAGQLLQSDGTCHVTTTATDSDAVNVHENSALLGAWARPWEALRLNVDLDLMSADKALYRTSPRTSQQYRGRAAYTAGSVSLGTSINISNAANDAAAIESHYRTRSYSFNAMVMRARLGVDADYDFNQFGSHSDICYVDSRPPAGTPVCPVDSTALAGVSTLRERTHFGLLELRWKPQARVTATLGYSALRAQGNTTLLNLNATPGSVDSAYLRPAASLNVVINPMTTFKTSWGRYDYGEDSPIGPTVSRNFRGDVVTVSLRYAF